MKWTKLGQLYCPESVHPKLISHAANPLPVHLDQDVYRIFYSGRDPLNRSSVGFVDADILKQKVIYVHNQPIFEFGASNSFFSHGVSIGNHYEIADKHYILFMGWQCPPQEHWRGDIGRIILDSNYSMQLDGNEPFIGINNADPISLSYPWVMQNDSGDYQMWYGSTINWNAGNGEMIHVINHATSADGQSWKRHGLSVPYKLGVAQAFSRPTVIRDGLTYHMWFSYRSGNGQKYRIGYATSLTGGDKFELKLNEAGLDVSENGWDSEMVEYPFVFDHCGNRYMLYNGNDFGKTGFGLAILER